MSGWRAVLTVGRNVVGDNGRLGSWLVPGSSPCPRCPPRAGPRLAGGAAAGGLRGAVAPARRGRARARPGPGRRRRRGARADRRRPRLETGHRGAVHEGRPVRRAGAGRGPHARARPAAAGPAPADRGARRRPRAPAHRGVVRARPRLAGHGRAVPGAAARAGAPHDEAAGRAHRGRRVAGARRPDRLARLGVGARAFPALADSPWVLPALRRGPGYGSHVGGQLSTQALQVTFAKHAVRTASHLRATAAPSRRATAEELAAAYAELSYDSYRRLALAAGAPPVASRGSCGPCGPSTPPHGWPADRRRSPQGQLLGLAAGHGWRGRGHAPGGERTPDVFAHAVDLARLSPCPAGRARARPGWARPRRRASPGRRPARTRPARTAGGTGHQLGVCAAQPAEEPLARTGPQVQRQNGDPGGARRGDRPDRGVQRRLVVGEPRQHRREEHPAGQPGTGDGPHQVQPGARRGDARLEGGVQRVVPDGDGDAEPDRHVAGGRGQQRHVATGSVPLVRTENGVPERPARRSRRASAGSGPRRAGRGRCWCLAPRARAARSAGRPRAPAPRRGWS